MRPLEQFSVLHIAGADAGSFLHTQLSNNIALMNEGDSRLAAYCEPKGRVLAVVLVYRESPGYFLVLNSTLEDDFVKRLHLYVLRSSVTIKSCRETHTLYGVLARDDEFPDSCWSYPPDNARKLYLVSRDDSPLDIAGGLTTQQWNLADIECGLAWLDSTTTGRFLPQALNLVSLGAVDFSKGCYPGQEVIARVHYLGSVKRELLRMSIPGVETAAPGEQLYYASADGQQQKAGEIVAAAPNNQFMSILSVLKTNIYTTNLIYYIKKNNQYTVTLSGNQSVPALP